jgi:serine/threonine protein phosphatase PrpC
MKITVFTEGKLPPKNEDAYGHNKISFVVCDGSTSKKDVLYTGKTGGEIASALLVETTFKRAEVKTIEIYTDGYNAVPTKSTIDAFERLHAQIEKEDPDKWKKYPSTKSHDDRTVMIIEF